MVSRDHRSYYHSFDHSRYHFPKLNNGFISLGFKPTKRLELGVEWTRMNYLAQQPGGWFIGFDQL